jgi:hypothetical protein
MDLPELARLQAQLDLSPEPARTLEALGLDELTWRNQQEEHLAELADALDRGESEPLERFTAAYEAAKRELSGSPPAQAAVVAAEAPRAAPAPAPSPAASIAEDDTARLPSPFAAQAPATPFVERGAPTAFVPSRVAEVDETAALPRPSRNRTRPRRPQQRLRSWWRCLRRSRLAELAATAALPPAPPAATPQARGQVEPARPGQRFTASPSQGFAPPPKAGPAFLEPRPPSQQPSSHSPPRPSCASRRAPLRSHPLRSRRAPSSPRGPTSARRWP